MFLNIVTTFEHINEETVWVPISCWIISCVLPVLTVTMSCPSPQWWFLQRHDVTWTQPVVEFYNWISDVFMSVSELWAVYFHSLLLQICNHRFSFHLSFTSSLMCSETNVFKRMSNLMKTLVKQKPRECSRCVASSGEARTLHFQCRAPSWDLCPMQVVCHRNASHCSRSWFFFITFLDFGCESGSVCSQKITTHSKLNTAL